MNRTEVESKPFIDRSVDIAESTRNAVICLTEASSRVDLRVKVQELRLV